ncbi:MAG TPA: AzlD domain-containing protein [Thermoleophilaceae bacterium]|nr:AzlD domain-containing protein [Thermoleophilaceae bacterium]
MSTAWAAVVVIGAATVAIKAAGPVLAGGRELPDRLGGVVELLAPAVLAALVVTQAVGGDEELVIDERLAGVGVAAVAIALKAPILVSVTTAAVVTALLRLAT